jgi:dCMP deaminase
MKEKFIKAYMDTAYRFAELSPARRLHVGAIIVKDDRIISIGYNGMPVGWDNECERKEYMPGDAQDGKLYPLEEYDPMVESNRRYKLVTKDEVLHAESNAIAKLARSNDSGLGATLFVTHSPCIHCAKLILQSGISRVWFGQAYRDSAGIDFLKNSGVEVKCIERQDDNSEV